MSLQEALVHVWSQLTAFPNIALDADYTLINAAGLRAPVYLTFLTRFSQDGSSQDYRNLNTHLLDTVPCAPPVVQEKKQQQQPKKRKYYMIVDDEDEPKKKKTKSVLADDSWSDS